MDEVDSGRTVRDLIDDRAPHARMGLGVRRFGLRGAPPFRSAGGAPAVDVVITASGDTVITASGDTVIPG